MPGQGGWGRLAGSRVGAAVGRGADVGPVLAAIVGRGVAVARGWAAPGDASGAGDPTRLPDGIGSASVDGVVPVGAGEAAATGGGDVGGAVGVTGIGVLVTGVPAGGVPAGGSAGVAVAAATDAVGEAATSGGVDAGPAVGWSGRGGAAYPIASATPTSTRLSEPSATTSRARCDDVRGSPPMIREAVAR